MRKWIHDLFSNLSQVRVEIPTICLQRIQSLGWHYRTPSNSIDGGQAHPFGCLRKCSSLFRKPIKICCSQDDCLIVCIFLEVQFRFWEFMDFFSLSHWIESLWNLLTHPNFDFFRIARHSIIEGNIHGVCMYVCVRVFLFMHTCVYMRSCRYICLCANQKINPGVVSTHHLPCWHSSHWPVTHQVD